jgi:hypothetical protein
VNRDQILEQALKHELRGGTPQPGGSSAPGEGCVDAETLAAWQDEGLDAAQMAAVELHLSTCARCQAMLAAFARGTPAISSAADTVDTVSTASESSWWRWWFAPLVAGAAAVTMWMVVPEQQQIATSPAKPQASVAVDLSRPGTASEEKTTPAEAAPPEARVGADSAAKEGKLMAEAAREDRQALKDAPAAAPKRETEIAQAAPPAAAPPAPPPTASPAPAAGYAPAAPPAAAARAEVRGRVGDLQQRAQSRIAAVEIAPPGSAIRWRVIDNNLERSDNSGATWTVLRALSGETITGGAAASDGSCWLIGRGGVVLVAGDGTTFTRVDLPERADVMDITASSARDAIVTTADGRRFRTTDGGRTWSSM